FDCDWSSDVCSSDLIDIGAKDGDEARALASVGDVAVIRAEPIEFPNNRVVSRSLDNRVGCFVAYETLRLLAEDGPAPGDFHAVRSEERRVGKEGRSR